MPQKLELPYYRHVFGDTRPPRITFRVKATGQPLTGPTDALMTVYASGGGSTVSTSSSATDQGSGEWSFALSPLGALAVGKYRYKVQFTYSDGTDTAGMGWFEVVAAKD